MIKAHQVTGLMKCGQYDGCYAGFLFNFRHHERKAGKRDKTYYISIHDFYKFLDDTDKKSINEADIIEYGGIEVQDRLVSTRFRYNIGRLGEDVIEYENNSFEKIKFDLDRYEKKMKFKK
jgi:penicillin-binding protein-related factor A (putative recombinase)